MRTALVLAVMLASAPAWAQTPITVGVAAPLSGPSAVLGRQIASGAGEAAGTNATVIAADTGCTAEGGAAAARQFVADDVDIVVGFLCTAEITAALPILGPAGIPVIAAGVRANRLTDRRSRDRHLVWRIAPRSDAEADALADFVRAEWRDAPFGIVEDGSVYGRDLADEVRARLGPESIEPALVDNYRPAEEVQFALARRILQSGVTNLLVFGSREDVAILARDAGELDLDLDIVGGESLLDAPGERADLPEGVRAMAIADAPADTVPMREGYHAPSHAATQIAIEALARAAQEEIDLPQALNTGTFDTVLGPIAFDEKGDGRRHAFRLLVFDGEEFRLAPPS